MRNLIAGFLICCLLVSCVEVTQSPPPESNPEPSTQTQQQGVRYFRSAADGESRYRSLSRAMEPRIERTCRQYHANKRASFCDFQFKLNRDTRQAPNAFQSLDNQGRPVITFNINLLRSMANNDEIAFVIGHEAGHQIASHLIQARGNIQAGAAAGSILAGIIGADPQIGADLGGFIGSRAYSKEFELEADTIGTHIAYSAGYSPIKGIGYFQRTQTGSSAVLATHPPSNDRIRRVQNEYNRILQSGGTAPLRW